MLLECETIFECNNGWAEEMFKLICNYFEPSEEDKLRMISYLCKLPCIYGDVLAPEMVLNYLKPHLVDQQFRPTEFGLFVANYNINSTDQLVIIS